MGIEPTSPHGPKEAVFPEGGAESGALFGDDERLRLLLEAWAELTESVKDTVRSLVLRSPPQADEAECRGCQFFDPPSCCAARRVERGKVVRGISGKFWPHGNRWG